MKKIKEIIKNPNYAHSLLMGGGTILNSVLGLLFYILAARVMGPSFFGEFMVYISLGILLSEVGDWGMLSGLLKFSAGGSKLSKYFPALLVVKVSVGFLFLVFGAVGGLFFNQYYFLTSFVAISLLLINLTSYSFLAGKNFVSYLSANLSANLVRLVFAYILFTLVVSNVANWLILYSSINFSFFIVSLIFLIKTNREKLIHRSSLKEPMKELIGFSRWVGGSFGIASFLAKIDVPLIYALTNSGIAGIYASAQRLTSIVPLVSSALDNVFAPKMSSENREMIFWDYLRITGFISACLILGYPIYDFLILFVFGSAYAGSIVVFKWLIAGMILFILSSPFTNVVIYGYGKPKMQFFVSLSQLFLTLILYISLLPRFGLLGIISTFILVQLSSLIVYIFIYLRLRLRND